MALIFRGQTPCAICGKVIEATDEVVATSYFIADQTDPLWRFSDAGFHRLCFLGWEYRQTIVARFNQVVERNIFGNGTHHYMMADGTIVTVPADPATRDTK
jgi:hypothetical protein